MKIRQSAGAPDLPTISHLTVGVDDAAGLFRGQGLNWILLALAHIVVESKAVEGARGTGTWCKWEPLGFTSVSSGILMILHNRNDDGHD